MSIFFFTDPHLGLNRMSHTTPASRARMQDKLYDQVQQVFHLAGDSPVICLGDLFDKTENDEAVIKQGADVAQRCAAVLAGNHDLPNREGKLSSLQLLDAVGAGRIIVGGTDEPGFDNEVYDEAVVWFVPHMATQELFRQSLQEVFDAVQAYRQEAEQWATTFGQPAVNQHVLCLHCNYNNGFAEGSDTSLNLTRDRAKNLLEVFDYVLLGHEHICRTDYEHGRLMVLGNTLPLGFGEIDQRYCWELKDGELIEHVIWDDDGGFAQIDVNEGWVDEDYLECEFIEFVGAVDAAEMPSISRVIHKFWDFVPGALMIKNSVTIKEAVSVDESRELAKLADVPTRIAQDLAGTKLLDTWNHYLEKVRA